MNPVHKHINGEKFEGGHSPHGVVIDVVDLSYGVIKDKVVKRLLKNVSITLKSGTMCALMGPSGAGKR